jgi:hypothetical protein
LPVAPLKKKIHTKLVIVTSTSKHLKENLPVEDSFKHFQESELGASFKKLFKPGKVPFKYHTLKYLQKILICKETENDIREFRIKESRVRKNWMYETKMTKDIGRTKHLKDNERLHDDARRVVEFYC